MLTKSQDEEKAAFTEKLEKVPNEEYTVTQGDLNAQICADTSGSGKFGKRLRNQEGENLLHLCNRNQ